MIRNFGWTLVLTAGTVFLVPVGSAQEAKQEAGTEKKEAKPDGSNPRLGVDDMVDRMLAFDKNKDGKLTQDELPERLQNLIEKGDLDQDGALVKDEIRKLAGTPGLLGEARPQARREGGPVNLEGVIDDLGVRGEKRRMARAAVQAHQNEVREFMRKAQADLLIKMNAILSEAEFQEFKAALGSQRPGGEGPREGNRPAEPNRGSTNNK